MAKTVKVVETELKPAGPGSRKSFYRKAFVLDDLNGTRYLKSYGTIVCSADADGYVRKYAEIESTTTNRHLKSFLRLYAPGDRHGRRPEDGRGEKPSRPRCRVLRILRRCGRPPRADCRTSL